MPLWSQAACKGNILFTEIPCNYALGCFGSMIKELTELHQRKCTNHRLKIKISLAAASHIIILMLLQRWIRGIFEIPGGIHALLDVRVQLVMSEPACVFRQGSGKELRVDFWEQAWNTEHNRGIMGMESNGYPKLQTPKSAMLFICYSKKTIITTFQ